MSSSVRVRSGAWSRSANARLRATWCDGLAPVHVEQADRPQPLTAGVPQRRGNCGGRDRVVDLEREVDVADGKKLTCRYGRSPCGSASSAVEVDLEPCRPARRSPPPRGRQDRPRRRLRPRRPRARGSRNESGAARQPGRSRPRRPAGRATRPRRTTPRPPRRRLARRTQRRGARARRAAPARRGRAAGGRRGRSRRGRRLRSGASRS